MKQKKYIQEAFNASLSEVFITDTQEPSKQEQIQDGCIYIFKKGKKYRTEMWFWKNLNFVLNIKRMI